MNGENTEEMGFEMACSKSFRKNYFFGYFNNCFQQYMKISKQLRERERQKLGFIHKRQRINCLARLILSLQFGENMYLE